MELCFQADTKTTLVPSLFFLFKKRVTQLPQHSALRFLPSMSRNISPFSFYFLKSIISCSFPATFPVWPVIHHRVLCDPFHRAHHGNLVRPGKNAPQRTQGHILYKKGQSIWILFPPPSQQLLAGMAKHKTGSVWQKPLLFIDWQTRMTEWLTHLH